MLSQRLQQLIEKAINRRFIHSVVLSVQSADGTLLYAGAAGHADAERTRSMQPDTPFFIASITKMYTAAVAMALHSAGTLDLDAPITRYLPDELVDGIHVFKGHDYSRELNVHDLLAQTSGLADYFETALERGEPSYVQRLMLGEDIPITPQAAADFARKKGAHFAPDGRRAHYSDTNFQLLGAVIESAGGRSLREAFAGGIFTPLGLSHTYAFNADLSGSGAPGDDPQPAVFYHKETPVHIPQAMSSFVPDGGIVSTTGDMHRFLRGFYGGELFDASLLERMTAQFRVVFPPFIGYGMGMMRFKQPKLPLLPSVPPFIGHSGANNAFAFYEPESGLTVTGTLNQMHGPAQAFTLAGSALRAALRG